MNLSKSVNQCFGDCLGGGCSVHFFCQLRIKRFMKKNWLCLVLGLLMGINHSPKFGEYYKVGKALHAALTVTVSTNSIKLFLD